MKKTAFFLASLFVGTGLLSSCESNKSAETSTATAPTETSTATDSAGAGTEHSEKAGSSATTTYECPMGDGGQSNAPGKCPKCGMDLEKKS
ncbi:MAG TPA: heavy metal-binding domain-containing protein [Hymenobacter sp.]|jgi:hypothetical protein